MPGYRYLLRTADGGDVGEVELGVHPQPGEEIRIAGNRVVAVTAVLPLERVGEFVERPTHGVLEIAYV